MISTLKFLKDLQGHNEKSWFDANRAAYQAAKTEVEQLAQKVIDEFGIIDPDIASLEAKKCTFRINRDVRFSNDKTPYKTNMGMWMAKGGKKSVMGGYYIHIEPGKSFFGGGVYMPQTPELKKVRQEVAYCFEEFKSIIDAPDFKAFYGGVTVEGHTLVKVPAGYDPNHRAAEFLKLKSYFGICQLSDEQLCNKELLPTLVKGLGAAAPLVAFINRAISDDE